MKFKIILNSDANIVDQIRTALKENDGYCPCELAHIPDTKCMCKAFRSQDYESFCHCGLYQKIKCEEEIDAKKMEE